MSHWAVLYNVGPTFCIQECWTSWVNGLYPEVQDNVGPTCYIQQCRPTFAQNVASSSVAQIGPTRNIQQCWTMLAQPVTSGSVGQWLSNTLHPKRLNSDCPTGFIQQCWTILAQYFALSSVGQCWTCCADWVKGVGKKSPVRLILILIYLLNERGEVGLVCRLALADKLFPLPARVNKPGLGSVGT